MTAGDRRSTGSTTGQPQADPAEVSEETPAGPGPTGSAVGPVVGSAGSFGDAAAEMANETEVEGGEADQPEAEGPSVERQLEERTADLQRLQAEYVNYKQARRARP